MPRLTRNKKNARKAKAEALKASEASTNGNNNDNTVSTSNSSPCGSSSHLLASGGETRVLAAGESNHENVTKSNASEVVQDNRPEKSTAELGKERSDGGERGPGEHKHQKLIEGNASPVVQDKGSEKSTAEIGKERSDGGERGPGEHNHQKVTEVNAFIAVQDKRAERSTAEIAKDRSGGGERGPSRNSGEKETVSLRPSQLESKQKQRDESSSFAGNKGFRQDFNGRNSTASQNYGGYNSRQGGQPGYYQNRSSGRGGYNESDSKRIDALGRALSSVLRHKAPQLGLKVRSDGYVVVKDLLSLNTKTFVGLPLKAHSVDDLREAVKRDNKQRFGLLVENGKLLIRANQGHSLATINSAELLEEVRSAEEIPVCIHGTYIEYLESIKREGLNRMTRNHIHFLTGYNGQDGVISGTQRPVYGNHGLQHNLGRHKDIFDLVAQLRAELEALRDEVEQRGIMEEQLHRDNFELGSEVVRLRSIIEGMEMMCGSRSHS